MPEYVYGFKMLSPDGATEQYAWDGVLPPLGQRGFSVYNTPNLGEKYAETRHPSAISKLMRMNDCGPYRIHVYDGFRANGAPRTWWPWFARIDRTNLHGTTNGKYICQAVSLRRIRPDVLARWIGLGLVQPYESIRGLRLRNMKIRGAKWESVHARNTSFEACHFVDCTFTTVDFEGADLSHARFERCKFYNCVFDGTRLNHTAFVECQVGACIRDTSLNGCSFADSNLALELYRVVVGFSTVARCIGSIIVNRSVLLYGCTFTDVDLALVRGDAVTFDACQWYGCVNERDPKSDKTHWPIAEIIRAILADRNSNAREFMRERLAGILTVTYRESVAAILNQPLDEVQ